MKRLLLLTVLFLSFGFAQAQQLCRAVSSFGAIPLNEAAVVIWDGIGATKYELQYRKGSVATYTSVIITATGGVIDSATYRLTGLTTCTGYAYRLRAICGVGDSSAWSRVAEFKTLGCPTPCTAPLGLFGVGRDSSAVLGWSPTTNAVASYVIMWKRASDSTFTTVNSATNSLSISGLRPCTEYQFKVKTVCSATASSDFSSIKSFKTAGCATPCTTPREVKAVATNNTIVVGWIGSLPAAYEVQYKVGADSVWRSVNSAALVYTLTNTTSCTPYTFRVRMLCSATASSEWSSSVRVTSSGCVNTECNAPRSLSASGVATSATLKWDTTRGSVGRTYDIQYMSSTDTAWRTISGVSGNVYNLTGLTSCKTYAFRVRTNCSATASSVWSAPMRFSTTGCPPPCKAPNSLRVTANDTVIVVTWTGAAANYRVSLVGTDSVSQPRRTITVAGTSTTITGLARCKSYILTVQSLCDSGRVSDNNTYRFETRCATNCSPVSALGSEITSDTVAILKFTFLVAQSYTIQYRVAGTTAWTSIQLSSITAAAIPYRLTGLQKCKSYEWRVIRQCGAVGTAESRIESFKTKGCVSTSCPRVTEMSVSSRGDSTVIEANSNGVAGARYLLYVRLVNGTRVDTILSATPRFVLRGLTLCQNYVAKLVVLCNGAISDATEKTFKPGTNCLWDGDIEGFLANTNTTTFGISPNPGREAVQVTYQLGQTAQVTIQIMNLQGQVVNNLDAGTQDKGDYVQTLDGLANLQTGFYFVVLRADGKVVQTLKWQKQ